MKFPLGSRAADGCLVGLGKHTLIAKAVTGHLRRFGTFAWITDNRGALIDHIGSCGPERSGKQFLTIAWWRIRDYLAQ